jgi:hypothetical protein
MPKSRIFNLAAMRRTAVGATVGVALTAGLAGIATPAAAVPAYTASAGDEQCLSFVLRDWGMKKQLWAYNKCSSQKGFSVRRAGTFRDEVSPCITVPPYKWAGWQWPRGRAYKSHKSCVVGP